MNSPVRAREQIGTHRLFKMANAVAYRGRTHIQRLRGRLEAAEPNRNVKGLKRQKLVRPERGCGNVGLGRP